ncbi:MAG: AI-2E family transporter, partial [Gammaproteobacteria bacterium]
MSEEVSVRYRRWFLIGLTVVISVVFLVMVKDFLLALFFAAVLSGMAYPLYQWLVKRFRGREGLASATTVIIVLLAIIGPVTAFFGIVAAEAIEVTERVAPWVEKQLAEPEQLQASLPDWIPFSSTLQQYRDPIMAKIGELASTTAQFLVNSLSKATRGTVIFFLNLFVMLYTMFFFFTDGRRWLDMAIGYLPMDPVHANRLIERVQSITRATLKGTFLIGAIQGALGGIAFAVAGIHGAVFWGTVIAVLSIIPGVGSALVWIPAVIWLVIENQYITAVLVTIWFVTVVGLSDNFLRPRFVGRDTKMPDVLILLATLGGLTMFGA